MTTYTNTKVGQVTEVRAGVFAATLNTGANGDLPMVTVAGEEVPVGQAGGLGAAGVDHNGNIAGFHGKLFELGPCYRVGICRVGPDDHDAIRMPEVFNGIGGSTGPERALHPKGGWGMAHPGAAINVVGLYDCPEEFLHQVVLFICTT